jgi:6,7-dimethyl-8-ribityllumazine synthase
MFDFTDKAFDQMTFSVKMPVNRSLMPIITARWNDDFRTRMVDRFNKRLRIITFISNQITKLETGNEILGLPMVARFAARQDKPQRIS